MNVRQPNILFFLPDQHRPDWLGGNPDLPLRTPNLDRLCARGIQFTNAFTLSPTFPMKPTATTGWRPTECAVCKSFPWTNRGISL
jgi:arylsulfatase A-like enzyme